MKTATVLMTPKETTTTGYLKIKEWEQPMVFKFLPDADFRGSLKSVEWNVEDNVKHIIKSGDKEFDFFKQVGERPEIEVSSDWIDSLGLAGTKLLRIRFEFDTFRMEPVWYAFLYLKRAYGDIQKDSDAAYKVEITLPKDEENVPESDTSAGS